jgi:GTP:adenosylcobinamide-phosphate guanylyltransferase
MQKDESAHAVSQQNQQTGEFIMRSFILVTGLAVSATMLASSAMSQTISVIRTPGGGYIANTQGVGTTTVTPMITAFGAMRDEAATGPRNSIS